MLDCTVMVGISSEESGNDQKVAVPDTATIQFLGIDVSGMGAEGPAPLILAEDFGAVQEIEIEFGFRDLDSTRPWKPS